MTANNPVLVESTPVIAKTTEKKICCASILELTARPSGKTICLSDVTISGRAFDAQSTAISSTIGTDNTTEAYFSIDGRQQQSLSHGINLVRLTDGSVRKIFKVKTDRPEKLLVTKNNNQTNRYARQTIKTFKTARRTPCAAWPLTASADTERLASWTFSTQATTL